MAEPPRLTKKKALREESAEGTPFRPLLISDWSNAQITSYCNACGISFDGSASHLDECIDFIRKVEKSRSLTCVSSNLEQAEISSEVRDN